MSASRPFFLLPFLPARRLPERHVLPLIVSKGIDQKDMQSGYERQPDGRESVMRNYGELLLALAKTVPDGLVCFFASYPALEQGATSSAEH